MKMAVLVDAYLPPIFTPVCLLYIPVVEDATLAILSLSENFPKSVI